MDPLAADPSHIQEVPDHCDRIIWRGRYYHLENMRPKGAERKAMTEYEKSGLAPMFSVLRAAIEADPEYAWAWHCNIAMPMIDSGCPDKIANEGAARVMRNIFQVDTSQLPHFRTARGIRE